MDMVKDKNIWKILKGLYDFIRKNFSKRAS